MCREEGQSPDEPGAASEQVRSERRNALVAFLRSIRRSEKSLGEIDDDRLTPIDELAVGLAPGVESPAVAQ